MTDTPIELPADFLLGAATAAYQIEGAVSAGGRGASIWDTFAHTPGAIERGEHGDVACDHYHRWREDIALMRAIGLDAYRFSIAWSRILPAGRGAPSQPGIDFYRRLIEDLLAAGIRPFATLYHWDLPQALQDQGGGWLRRGVADDFAAYADVVTRALGDLVQDWTTLNEPWVFAWHGYGFGEDAPGLRLGPRGALAATHHALLAHGAAVPAIRANVPGARVGIVLDLNMPEPAGDSPADRAAAERFLGFQNRWYLDPLFRGGYPDDMLALYGDLVPELRGGDMAQIGAPLDYLGVNFYRRSVIAAGDELPPISYRRVSPPGEYTAMGWEVSPRGLADVLGYVHRTYAPKALYVTENGAAFDDQVAPDGQVHDPRRTSYLRAHLAAARQAIDVGVPLKGYFVWTLLDNFEWACGYRTRFGLVHVDFATQRRLIKDSGRALRGLVRRPR